MRRRSRVFAQLGLAVMLMAGPLASSGAAADAPLQTIDVRPGVTYVRVRDAIDPATLATSADKPGLILDLRFFASAEADATGLTAFATRRTTDVPKGLTVVLVNAATAGPVLGVLESLQSSGHLLLVGVTPTELPSLVPAHAIAVDPEADQLAYLAYQSGTPLATLLDPPVDKTRFDEAHLLQVHGQNGSRNGATQPPRPAAAPRTERRSGTTLEETPAPPRDRILLRAVNLFAALEALRRFPPR